MESTKKDLTLQDLKKASFGVAAVSVASIAAITIAKSLWRSRRKSSPKATKLSLSDRTEIVRVKFAKVIIKHEKVAGVIAGGLDFASAIAPLIVTRDPIKIAAHLLPKGPAVLERILAPSKIDEDDQSDNPARSFVRELLSVNGLTTDDINHYWISRSASGFESGGRICGFTIQADDYKLNHIEPRPKHWNFEKLFKGRKGPSLIKVLSNEKHILTFSSEGITAISMREDKTSPEDIFDSFMPDHFTIHRSSTFTLIRPTFPEDVIELEAFEPIFNHWDMRIGSNKRFKVIIQGDTGSGKTQGVSLYLRSRGIKSATLVTSGIYDGDTTRLIFNGRALIIDDFDRMEQTDSISLLLEMASRDGIFIGNCNNIRKLPKALRRPGRIDQVILWPKPTARDLEALAKRNGVSDKLMVTMGEIIDHASKRTGVAGVDMITKAIASLGDDFVLLKNDITFDQPTSIDRNELYIVTEDDEVEDSDSRGCVAYNANEGDDDGNGVDIERTNALIRNLSGRSNDTVKRLRPTLSKKVVERAALRELKKRASDDDSHL